MLRRLTVLAALAAVAAVVVPTSFAASPNVVISQVYGGGGNSGATLTHDFIELFNRGTTTVSLEGWSLQYGSSAGNFGTATNLLTPLSGSIPAGGYVLVQEAQGAGGTTPLPPPFLTDATPIAMSATGGKVALVNTTTPLACSSTATCTPTALATIVDLVGYGSGASFFEGSGPTAATSNTTAAVRKNGGCTETDDNAADFDIAAPAPRNFSTDPVPCGGPVNQPVAIVCGGPLTAVAGVGATRAITASDADGTVTSITLGPVTPAPAAGSISLTAFTPASAAGGTASATLAVSADVPTGVYTAPLQAANNDATPQTADCSVTVNVLAVRTIGEVQGAVLDSDVGTLHRSSFAPPPIPPAGANGLGQTVVVRGVITQRTLARSSSGANQNGFFLQNTTTTDDDNPLTSDGIFVFMGGFPDLIGGYQPQVGDEVVISGRVNEFFFFTQLSSASLVMKFGSFADLDAVTPAFEVAPPNDLSDALRYWERRESMRGAVPAGAKTVDGLDVFPSTADGELWMMRGDHPVALRSDPFARRVFRDPHPLDNQPTPLFDDGNGYRILLASLGVKFAAGNNTVLLTPARTFDTITNSLVGGVYFTFGKYALQVTAQPSVVHGVDPSTNAPPSAFARDEAYSIADYNVENLYDFRDDPFDTCDFVGLGNPGCPPSSNPNATPFFDYVPASNAVYQARLGEFATQIVEDLNAPDILLAQEAEDQDICTVADDELVCGTTDNRDGKPDTLQELALRIETDHAIAYDAAYDRDGSDDRGIVAGFLYRSDRVELLPASADHPVLGSDPQVDYRGTPLAYNTQVSNPKALNADLPDDVDLSSGVDGTEVFTRDPQVGLFRIWRNAIGDGGFIDVYAISNHFSSTPDARRGQRTEQAAYNAAIVEALQTTAAGARIDVGGDFNVYPRPDDPVLPPSDQLGPLYDIGLTNLYDVLVEEEPSAAYSYVFQGQTQTLDGQFLTDTVLEELNEARIAHVNADFPADTPGDGARGLSDHDPLVTQLTVPSLPALVEYYADAGFITGNNTETQLLGFLARAASGGPNADAQLQAFIDHVEDMTPQFITPLAAHALIDEAERLLG